MIPPIGKAGLKTGCPSKILQITGRHLMRAKGRQLLGVDTDASLGSACRCIGFSPIADDILLAGDLPEMGLKRRIIVSRR